jgi:hypothetical protein
MASFLGRSLGGRLAIGLADSGVASAGNLGVSIIAARAASLTEFGMFATAMLILILATMVSRSAHGDALILKSGESDVAVMAEDRQRSTTSVVWLCTMLGLFTAAVGVVLGSTGATGFSSAVMTLIVGGTALPLLSLQEHLRWIEYARGSSQRAFINNLLWTVFSVGSLAVAAVAFEGEIPAYVCLMLWAYSTAPGIVYALVTTGVSIDLREWPAWLRLNRRLVSPLVMDLSLTQATTQGAVLVVAALSGAMDMAFIRKGQIWLGPATVATMGLLAALQPILAQRAAIKGNAAAVRLATVIGAVASGALFLYGLLVLLLPGGVAQILVGPGWAQSRPFVVALTVQAAASMMGGCLGLALRTAGLIGRQVRWRLLLAPVTIAVVATVTYLGSAQAGMWAVAAMGVVTALAWSALLSPRAHEGGRRVTRAL